MLFEFQIKNKFALKEKRSYLKQSIRNLWSIFVVQNWISIRWWQSKLTNQRAKRIMVSKCTFCLRRLPNCISSQFYIAQMEENFTSKISSLPFSVFSLIENYMYTIFVNCELWHLTHFISGLKIVTHLWTPICICQKRNFFTIHMRLLEKISSPSEEKVLIVHENISLLRSGKKNQPLPVKKLSSF